MKVKTDNDNEIELGKIKPCPFCGGSNLTISDKSVYDELASKNGGSLISIKCSCKASLTLYDIPDNNYYIGAGILIERWNGRR